MPDKTMAQCAADFDAANERANKADAEYKRAASAFAAAKDTRKIARAELSKAHKAIMEHSFKERGGVRKPRKSKGAPSMSAPAKGAVTGTE